MSIKYRVIAVVLALAVVVAVFFNLQLQKPTKNPDIAQLVKFNEQLQRLQKRTTKTTKSTKSTKTANTSLEQLLTARKAEMLTLMQSKPQLALSQAISFSDYNQIPDNLKHLVEKPITVADAALEIAVADNYDTTTGKLISSEHYSTLKLAENNFQVQLFGKRAELATKKQIAVQGITLDNWAVIYDKPIVLLDNQADIDYLKNILPAANTDNKDYLTGGIIHQQPLVAIGGGKLFYFASEANVVETNRQLAILDKRLDPNVSSATFLSQKTITENGVQSLLANQIFNIQLANNNSWSNSDKSIFFIRVNFSNRLTTPTSRAALKNYLNTDIDSWFQRMSYGRVNITADVSAQIHTLNSTSSYSSSSSYNSLYNDALAAFNSGNDTSGANLSDYDIVGVIFVDYGVFNWAGFATINGSKLWIKLGAENDLSNVFTASVIPHELGHNFGLRHASYYNGDSVIGTTSDLDEYGNIFDIMGDGFLPESGVSTYNKQRLDWFNTNNIEYISSSNSGNYRLYRFDAIDATDTLTIRLERNSSNADYYWLGYQKNYEDDGSFDYGLAINWQRPGKTDRVYLLDMTPGSKSYSVFQPRDLDDSPLTIGHTYHDASANLYLTPYKTGGTSPNFWIDSQINYGSFPNNNSPTATLSMASTASVGELVVISVNASDSNGDSLAFAWDTGDSTVHKNYSTIAQVWKAGSGGTRTVKLRYLI